MWRKRMLFTLVALCALIVACLAFGAGGSGTLEQTEKANEDKKYIEEEKGYLEIAAKGGPEGLTAQRQLALLYIGAGDMVKADTAYQQLCSRFSGQEGISKEVWEVARGYNKAGEKAKSLEVNKYNVDHYPKNKYAMWSQVEIAYSHISDGDESEADEAVNKLLNTFSEQESLPKEIHNIAKAYSKAKRNDKAIELYKYNVDYYPQDKYAMWSQVESVYYHVQDGNETAADKAVDKLIEVFSEQPTLPKELYQVGMKYRGPRFKRKALELHEYNVEHYPNYDDVHAMWSQVEIAKLHVRNGNEVAAQQAYNKLLMAFSGQETLPKEVCIVGDVYCQQGNCEKATQIYQSVMNKWPGSEQLVWTRAGMAKVDIALGDEDSAKAKTDSLVVDFNDNPDLAEAVSSIAAAYWSDSLALEREGYLGPLSSLILADRTSVEAVGKLPDQLMTDGAKQWEQLPENQKNERIEKQMRRLYGAIYEWDRIINELPEDSRITPEAYFYSANCHRKLGEYEKAVQKYETLVERWPNFAQADRVLYRMAACYGKLVQSEAIAVDQAALKIRDACLKLLNVYPDSGFVKGAEIMQKQWAYEIRKAEEK